MELIKVKKVAKLQEKVFGRSDLQQKIDFNSSVTCDDNNIIVVGSKGTIRLCDQGGRNLAGYQGSDDDVYYDIAKVGNNFLVVGKVGGRGCITRLKKEGEGFRDKSYIYTDAVYSSIEPIDSGAILLSPNIGISKCDSNGNIEWSQSVTGCYVMTVVNDGIVVDSKYQGNLQKFDFNGNLQWSKSRTSSIDYNPIKSVSVSDGFVEIGERAEIVKYDNDGNLIWINTEKKSDTVILGSTQNPDSIFCTDAFSFNNKIVVVLRNKKIITFADYGRGSGVKNEFNIMAENISCSSKGDVVAVGDGLITKFAPGFGYYLASDNQLTTSKGFGEQWSIKSADFSAIINNDNGRVYAVGSDGYLGTLYINGMNSTQYNFEKKYNYTALTDVQDGIVAVGNNGEVVKYLVDGDRFGKVEWESRTYGYTYKGVAAIDDGVIVVGNSSPYGTRYKYPYIAKYNNSGTQVWSKIDETNQDVINGIAKVNGGFVTIANSGKVCKYNQSGEVIFSYNAIDTGSLTAITSVDGGFVIVSSEGQVMKYDSDGNLLWRNIDSNYNYTEITSTANGIVAASKEGRIVKYDNYGDIEWETWGPSDLSGVAIDESGNIVAVSTTGRCERFRDRSVVPTVAEVANVQIQNNILKYNITTEISQNSKNQRTGGTITGEYNEQYKEEDNIKFVEQVKYNYNNENQIDIIPSDNYYIYEILINGIKLEFNTNEDGSVTLPKEYFKDITEDKHIAVRFEEKQSFKNLLIKKIDKTTKQGLYGAKFTITSIVEEGSGEAQTTTYAETNSEGIAKISLKQGKYEVKETKAPKLYTLNNTPQTVTIDDVNSIKEIQFENEKQEPIENNYNFILTKKDKQTSNPLQGVKFTILDKDGNYAKDNNGNIIGVKEEIDGQTKYVVTTDENGQIKLALNMGKYKVIETKPLEGYATEESKEIEITQDNVDFEMSWQGEALYVGYWLKDHIRATSDGGAIQIVPCTTDKRIPAEDTIENKEIIVEKDKAILIKYNNGKIENLLQVEGYTNGGGCYEDKDGNYIFVGLGKQIQIPAKDTKDGKEIILPYAGTSDRTVILKLDSNFKVIWASKIDGISIYTSMNTPIIEDKSGDYLLGVFNPYPYEVNIPAEDTVNGETISLPGTSQGTDLSILIKYNKEGKIKFANRILGSSPIQDLRERNEGGYILSYLSKPYIRTFDAQLNEIKSSTDNINGINLRSYPGDICLTNDDGYIAGGKITSNTTISPQDTKSGEEIQISAENYPSAILIKYDKNLKVEWIKINNAEYGTNESITAVKQDSLGNYISLINFKGNMYKLIKYNSSGEIVNASDAIEPDVVPYIYIDNDNTKFVLVKDSYLMSCKFGKADFTPLELNITNQKSSKVEVHHYLEKTGEEFNNDAVKLAEDEVLEGKVPDEYTTSPNMNITGYKLLRDKQGEYIIPNNASGTYKEQEQNVYYYYNKKPFEVTVHHYLEGTKDKLKEDEKYDYQEGEHYKVNPKEELLRSYELAEVIGNEEGDITKNEEITYYYKIKKYNITTKVELPEGRVNKGGTISGEDQLPYETVEYGKSSIKDIIIKPDEGYRLVKIKLVSINENGNKTENIIYGENAVENAEITYKNNIDGSLILTKFENMIENKQVIVKFEPDIGKLIVHHYIENSKEKIYDDQIIQDKVGTTVTTYPVKKENYIVVKEEPESRDATITKQVQEKTYYYQKQYKVTTDVKKYEEPNEEGILQEVVGGTISGQGQESYEDILKGRNSKKQIDIIPKEGFEIVEITINAKQYKFKDILKDDGSVVFREDFFKQVDEDKHVEVEFRRKTKVTVRYLEVETNKELAKEEIIQGYVGKDYETYRKNIENYKTSQLGITNEKQENIEPNGKMTKDEIIIIYWYEKVPSGVLVKYIEKVTNKVINEQTGKEDIVITQTLLDEEVLQGYAGEDIQTTRKEFESYISAENDELSNVISVPKDEDSKTVILKQDEVVEVNYWYEKEFNITTNVIEHEEQIEENKVLVKGGTISGEDEKPYEKVVRANSSTKEIKVIPDNGYRIKHILINKKEIFVENKISTDKTLVLDNFTNMQEDKLIEVEFEKIPTKIIVEYKDIYTKESVKKDKIVEGFVNDKYNELNPEIEGYVLANPKPQNNVGIMQEDIITITFWYIKQYKITTHVKKHEEQNANGDKILVKGGTISGEDQNPYEIVQQGKSNTKQIIIKPDSGYQAKEVTINGKVIEIKDQLQEDNTIIIPFFNDINEDKYIVVEYEKIQSKVRVQFLEKGTNKELSKEEIKYGYVNDKYETKEKEIKYYELVKEMYPENSKGVITKEEKVVKFYYQKLLFNMKIEKEIDKIVLDGKNIEVTDKNREIIEVKYKNLNETRLEVCYKIKVINTQKIEGIALIEEILPEGFELKIEESNANWLKKDNKYLLATQIIKPEETKEYKVTLKWKPEEKNKGEKINIAKIAKTLNTPHYEESTLDDNEAKAIIEIKLNKTINDVIDNVKEEIIDMPKTGQSKVIYIILGGIFICGISGLVYLKIKSKKKINKSINKK